MNIPGFDITNFLWNGYVGAALDGYENVHSGLRFRVGLLNKNVKRVLEFTTLVIHVSSLGFTPSHSVR